MSDSVVGGKRSVNLRNEGEAEKDLLKWGRKPLEHFENMS